MVGIAARAVKSAGGSMLRGGAFKPRTSPHAFQGLGLEGLSCWPRPADESGLPMVTEVLTIEDIVAVVAYADVLQVGARNMHNFALLKELGRLRQAGAPQARHERHHQGVAAGRRVHPGRGQPRR